jgi:glycosyltransferase involved in cell wall biosynthesis
MNIEPKFAHLMGNLISQREAGSQLASSPHSGRATRIALLGNFLPRLCGIATFTTHVHRALRQRWPDLAVDVYAMVDPGRSYDFPQAVVGTIDQENRGEYARAAAKVHASGADLLWIQHEYGIFGGRAGEYLLDMLDAVSKPIALTLHTVLETPNADQRRVLERLIARASVVIVMAERARMLLRRVYKVPADKVTVIEHGGPDRPYVTPSAARRRLGLEDRKTILTFGLLSPDKGIETMIRAMPAILARCPDALYRIVGATHPHLLAHEGERHRETLQELAGRLGVEEHLRWENRFLDEEDLLDRIAAADVYVTPYRNAQQITSGTLSYAYALGKPIVATPYVHARELLARGRGRLVGIDDIAGLAAEIGSLLIDDASRERMATGAHAHARAFTWNRMVARAGAAFAEIISDPHLDRRQAAALPVDRRAAPSIPTPAYA